MKQRVLVVCTGNICRSPLAAAMLSRDLSGRTIASAGLAAPVGAPADPMALEFAAARGLDLSAHRARHVTLAMCQTADLILVMELRQQAELRRRYPQVWGKVFRLGGVDGFDIADPYRKPRKAFEAACVEVVAGAAAWSDRIRQLEGRRELNELAVAHCA
ncbi:low molecular weight protein-tyrosine-phosphatase [Variovorax defluvii]|uniref:protein-tyrosine-phosphatase n=1 Tax=Variovorax defluvii TaxID=913761 RepID=A0ABP8IH04_9BURK